jgi:hypothetical protein
MEHMRDMIFVNNLEKRLNRHLTEDELNTYSSFKAVFPDGHYEYVSVPRLVFPDALITRPSDFHYHDDPEEPMGSAYSDPLEFAEALYEESKEV